MISVCFITKNEDPWIGECIDQLSGFVSEVIVVDTGSTDRTVEIAKSKGAKTFDFKWTGNFSEARNFSLSKATQPWILKIDPDERIDRAHLQKLVSLTLKNILAVRCLTRAYTNSSQATSEDAFRACNGEFAQRERGYIGYKEQMYARLFKNIPGAHYTGIIHEDIEPSLRELATSKDPIQWVPEIIFHHYGLDQKAVDLKNKTAVYKKMMEEEVLKNNQYGFVWYELANLYYQEGNYQLAADTFQKASDLDPKNIQTLNNLGHTLTLIGERERGEKYLRECLAVDSSNSNIWLNYAVSRMEAGDLHIAQNCFQKALTLSPDSLMAWRGYGQCLAHQGDYSNAEAAFRAAITRCPGFIDAKVDLAVLLDSRGQRENGIKLLNESLTIDPTNERVTLALKHFAEAKSTST
ncbi:MAG: glycosyltransferase [Bacteriovoracaceae bacterium]|nr:glycosyltransferase [Bacteriovoracaceae bacterium]